MKKLLVFLMFCFLSCSSNKIVSSNKSDLEYINRNPVGIASNSEEYVEEYFKIILPNKVKKIISTIGIVFQKKFYFTKNQNITTISSPKVKFKQFENQYNCTYSTFLRFLKENDLNSFFEKVKLIKNRKFSIIRLNENFIIVSLNIIKKNEIKYLESIKSFEFIDLNNFDAGEKFLEIYDRIENYSKGNGSISSVDFEIIQNLTNIKSESIESYDEIFTPTLETLSGWKVWFIKNKEKLYLDKTTQQLKLRQ